jgi:hypothetical protein
MAGQRGSGGEEEEEAEAGAGHAEKADPDMPNSINLWLSQRINGGCAGFVSIADLPN